jgi:hypothetical protein
MIIFIALLASLFAAISVAPIIVDTVNDDTLISLPE